MRYQKIFKKDYLELTGTIHNHTNLSYDCDVPLPKILKEATKARLDYITVNDHDVLYSKDELAKICEKFPDVTVISGCEVNDDKEKHHLLVFDSQEVYSNIPAEDYLSEYRTREAVIFAAHPYEERKAKKFSLYKWENEDLLLNVDAVEIWNFSSSWLSKLQPKFNGILMVIFPNLYVKKPFKYSIKLWDDLNKKKMIPAIGSTDAHGTIHSLFGLKFRILSHRYLFGTVRTNVLIEKQNETINEEKVLLALKNGNSYIVNYKMGRPYNFFCGITDGKENQAICGETIKYKEDLFYYFNLPFDCRVKFYHNGRMLFSTYDNKAKIPIKKKGFYRIEVTRFNYGWIYTNNIYVN